MRSRLEKQGFIVSLVLHVVFVIAISVGLPSLSHKPIIEPPPIFVEYAMIGPENQSPLLKKSAPSVRKTTKPPKNPAVPLAALPHPSAPTPPAKPTPSVSEKVAEKIPDKPAPSPADQPTPEKVKEKPKDNKDQKKDQPRAKQDEKPAVEDKALLDRKKAKAIAEETVKQKKPKPSAALAKVLAAVDKLEGSLEGEDLDVPEGIKSVDTGKIGKDLTMTEKDALLHQLKDCWNIPAGAPNPENLIVTIKLDIGPDAIVRKATIVNKERLSDPFFRAAAEAARRATFHPSCTPLKLPTGKYNQWKDLTLNFDPRHMTQ